MVTPLVGMLAGAVREYWYFHRSMDKLPHPEEMFRDRPARSRQAVANGDMGKRLRSGPAQALAAAGGHAAFRPSVHPAFGLDTSGRLTSRLLRPGAPVAPGHPLRAASFRT